MAVNKVVYGNDTLIDITDSTVNPQNVFKDYIFYEADGTRNIGKRIEKLKTACGQGSLEVDENKKWIRPEEYPNLDLVQFDQNYDEVYLTYDLRISSDINYISFLAKSFKSGNYTIERGHLENNIFIADQTISHPKDTYFRQALNIQNGEIQLWRLRVPISQQLYKFSFAWYTNAINKNMPDNAQPCIERKAKIDYITEFGTGYNSTSSTCWGCIYLKKDYLQSAGYGIVTGTSLDNIYYSCVHLVELDLTNINTSRWTPSRLHQTFYHCNSLVKLDLSTWDVSNWPMDNSSYGFNCTWYRCTSLEELNLSTWDTSNWNLKYVNGVFGYLHSLRKLDVSNWDTSNWQLTYFYNVFDGCFLLQELDLSNWDTSKWNPSTMSYCFSNCWSLEELDLSNWDTSGWTNLTGIISTFSSLISLKKFKQNFDTSKWKPTTIQSIFASCWSLEELDLSNWDTSGWITLTTISSVFSGCYCLKKLKLPTMTSAIGNTILENGARSMFYNCRSIKKIDMSMIDCLNWNINTLSNVFCDCHSLEQIILPKNLNLINLNNISSLLSTTYKLRKIEGQVLNSKLWPSFNTCFLQRNTVLNIFNMLPTISTATTLRIGVLGLQRVTAEEIAVATAKGWTVTT